MLAGITQDGRIPYPARGIKLAPDTESGFPEGDFPIDFRQVKGSKSLF
jgi:hypothetical protein